MRPRNKERAGWTEERRAKVAETWQRRHAEQTALDIASKKNTKRQGRICVYCGEKYELREHVPILRARVKLPPGHKIKFVLVPTCKECHYHLAYDESLTVTERRAHIKSILRLKYILFLDWQETEPTEHLFQETLSRHYRDLLDKLDYAHKVILRRLKYKEGE